MFNVTRPQLPDCLCPPHRTGAPPCPNIKLEIRIESIVPGMVAGEVVITYVVVDANTNLINPNLSYTWSVPSGHSFTQIGQHRIKITYNGSGGQIVIEVTATMPTQTNCDYSAVYTQPPCVSPDVTLKAQVDCNTGTITITACINGNCAYDPNYIYMWYLPGAVGVVFQQANVITLPMTQVLPDCTLKYLIYIFDVRTGCRTQKTIRGNVCEAPLLNECCNEPILSSICSLWLICPPPQPCTVDITIDTSAYLLCPSFVGSPGSATFTAFGDVVDVILIDTYHVTFRVLCNGKFTVRACANTTICVCPTTLTDGIARQPDRIVLGACAEWDLSTTVGSSRTVTVDSCAPCSPPYVCVTLPPQPPNTYLVEMTFAQSAQTNFPCANIIGNNQIPSPVNLPFGGFINTFNILPVVQLWIGQGNTLRVGAVLINSSPVPTLNGQVATGFHLGNPLNPYWDIVITGNMLIRFDTNYVYTPSLPGTIISIDPC